MKEFRRMNIISTKDGHGNITYKLAVPKTWADDLGFAPDNRSGIVEINKNKIIIRKVERSMLLIKGRNVEYVSSYADYELEDGTLLFNEDWNGEVYRNGWKDNKDTNCQYRPVYKFELDNINLDELEENSDAWDEAVEIVGFEEV